MDANRTEHHYWQSGSCADTGNGDDMKTIIVSIYGNVQGVGFRYFVLRTANVHKIPGSVKNEPDGSVTVKATGEAEALAVFLKAVEVGNGYSKVSCISVEEVPLVTFDDFRIDY